MSWSYMERRGRERNYRLMFKAAVAGCVLGLTVAFFGGVYAATTGDAAWLAFGLILAVLSVGSGWLTLDSTVRILELDMRDMKEEQDVR